MEIIRHRSIVTDLAEGVIHNITVIRRYEVKYHLPLNEAMRNLRCGLVKKIMRDPRFTSISAAGGDPRYDALRVELGLTGLNGQYCEVNSYSYSRTEIYTNQDDVTLRDKYHKPASLKRITIKARKITALEMRQMIQELVYGRRETAIQIPKSLTPAEVEATLAYAAGLNNSERLKIYV